MGGRLFLGNQMISPIIIQGEESPYTNLEDGVLTKKFGDASGISFPNIVEVGPAALAYGYENYQLQYGEGDTFLLNGVVSFPDLVKIGQKGLLGCFEFQFLITGCEFPKLEEIGLRGMESAFSENGGSLDDGKYVFPKLKKIGSSGLEQCFGYIRNSVFIFHSLGTDVSQVASNCFSDMLYSGRNNFVYFPSSTEQTIGSWSDVINGFSGRDTTVIFWIPTEITINIAQESAILETTDKIYNGVVLATGSTFHYVVYDSTLNKAFLGTEIDCIEDGEPRTVNVDLSTGEYNKITIKVQAPLSDITCTWNNFNVPLTEESENVYTVYVNSSVGEVLNVDVAQTVEHPAASAQITTNGEDIEEMIVLPELPDFIQPILTSNGTIGGDSFAVTGFGSSDQSVYKAFDGNYSTYWESTTNLEFYNPDPIRISEIVINSADSSHAVSGVTIMFAGNGGQLTSVINVTTSVSGNVCTVTPNTVGGFYDTYAVVLEGTTPRYITEITISGKVMTNAG